MKFSMIELVIAFVIIAIAVVGLIGFTPPNLGSDEAPKSEIDSDIPQSGEFCIRADSWKAERIINEYIAKGFMVKHMSASQSAVFVVFEKNPSHGF